MHWDQHTTFSGSASSQPKKLHLPEINCTESHLTCVSRITGVCGSDFWFLVLHTLSWCSSPQSINQLQRKQFAICVLCPNQVHPDGDAAHATGQQQSDKSTASLPTVNTRLWTRPQMANPHPPLHPQPPTGADFIETSSWWVRMGSRAMAPTAEPC